MLLPIGGSPSRLMVIAYDIPSPKRARAVRRLLDAVNHAKQYSVYETRLGPGQLRRLLNDVHACCDPSADQLAAWWPVDSARLIWGHNGLQIDTLTRNASPQPPNLHTNIGNFILCYDIRRAATLRTVSAEIAAECAMLQRSVYWLRASVTQLQTLLKRCAALLDNTDCLWAYPLGASRALWRMNSDDFTPSLLPISTHNW